MNRDVPHRYQGMADCWLIPLLNRSGQLSSRRLAQLTARGRKGPVFIQNLLVDRGILSKDQLYRLVREQLGVMGTGRAGWSPDVEQLIALGSERLRRWQVLPLLADGPELRILSSVPPPAAVERWLEFTSGKEIQWLFAFQRDLESTWVALSRALEWLRDCLSACRSAAVAESNMIHQFADVLLCRIAQQKGQLKAVYLPGHAVRLQIETRQGDSENLAMPSILWPSLLRLLLRLGGCHAKILKEKNTAVVSLPAVKAAFGARLQWREEKGRLQFTIQWVGPVMGEAGRKEPSGRTELLYLPELLRQKNGLLLVAGGLDAQVRGLFHPLLLEQKRTGKRLLLLERQPLGWTPGVVQVRWHPGREPDLPTLMRSFLTIDPSVVVLEPSGREVAIDMAVREARRRLVLLLIEKSGVFAALHLVQNCTDPETLARVFLAAVAVHRVPALCPGCRSKTLPLELQTACAPSGSPTKTSGCPACGFTGYAGWTLIHEYLPASPALKNALRQQELLEAVAGTGLLWISLQQSGLALICEGVTDRSALNQLFQRLGLSPEGTSQKSDMPEREELRLAGLPK